MQFNASVQSYHWEKQRASKPIILEIASFDNSALESRSAGTTYWVKCELQFSACKYMEVRIYLDKNYAMVSQLIIIYHKSADYLFCGTANKL